MRPREGEDSAEGHVEGKWWCQDLKSSLDRAIPYWIGIWNLKPMC